MTLKKTIILFTILVVGGIAIYFIPQSRFGPVAMVDYDLIPHSTLKDVYAASKNYYENIDKTYNIGENLTGGFAGESEFKRATLAQLIDDRLIEKELQKRVGSDLGSLIDKRLGDLDKDSEFQKAITGLSGMSYSEYKKLILIPQAKREILEGRLFLENVTLESWLEKARKEAKVVIFSSEFSWTDGNVELNGQ